MTGGAGSRRKGRSFESQVCKALQQIWPNARLNPVGTTGADIVNVPISVECKHQKTLAVPAWWRQTVAQADADGLPPVLVIRLHGRPRIEDTIWLFRYDMAADTYCIAKPWEQHIHQWWCSLLFTLPEDTAVLPGEEALEKLPSLARHLDP